MALPCIIIWGDQKVSVHLTITIQKQVHRDFLITLYYILLAHSVLLLDNTHVPKIIN